MTDLLPPNVGVAQDVGRVLKQHGIKPTAQRVSVAQLLLSRPEHLTADQVLQAVRAGGARLSKATVYNTLKVFAERGLVRQIHLDPERSVYDSGREPHHHFHVVDTNELVDISLSEIEFSKLPPLPEGMEAAAVEVVIHLRKKQPAE